MEFLFLIILVLLGFALFNIYKYHNNPKKELKKLNQYKNQ